MDGRTTTDLIQYPVDELKSLHRINNSFENVVVGVGAFVKLDGVSGNQVTTLPRSTILCWRAEFVLKLEFSWFLQHISPTDLFV